MGKQKSMGFTEGTLNKKRNRKVRCIPKLDSSCRHKRPIKVTKMAKSFYNQKRELVLAEGRALVAAIIKDQRNPELARQWQGYVRKYGWAAQIVLLGRKDFA